MPSARKNLHSYWRWRLGGIVRALHRIEKGSGSKEAKWNSKSESPLGNKGGQGQERGFLCPEPKDNILERNRTRLELWEEHLKDLIVVLDQALKCVENSCWAWILARVFVVEVVFNDLRRLPPTSVWEAARAFGSTWTRGIVCGGVERARELRAAWRALFLPDSEATTMPGSKTFSPSFTADIRTPISLCWYSQEVRAYRHALNSGRGKRWRDWLFPDLGNTWRLGCPQSNVGKWGWSLGWRLKRFLKCFAREQLCATVRCTSSGCMGLVARSLSPAGGLGACEGGVKLSHCPGYVVPGNAWGLAVGLMLPKEPLCHSKISLLSPWTGCDIEGVGMWWEKWKQEGTWVTSPFELARLSEPFDFCHSLKMVCLFGMGSFLLFGSASFFFVYVSEGRKEASASFWRVDADPFQCVDSALACWWEVLSNCFGMHLSLDFQVIDSLALVVL